MKPMKLDAKGNVLRMPGLCARLGLSKSSVYDKLSPNSPRYDPDFPKPIKLGHSAVGWLEESIDQWLERRIELSQR